MSDGCIIIMGGNNGAAFSNTVERVGNHSLPVSALDPIVHPSADEWMVEQANLVNKGHGEWGLDTWQELPKMMNRRGNFACCHQQNEAKEHLIYAVGELLPPILT